MTPIPHPQPSASTAGASRWLGAALLAVAGVAFVGWRTWSYAPSLMPAMPGPPLPMMTTSGGSPAPPPFPGAPPAGGPMMLFQQIDLSADQKARLEALRDQRLSPPEMARAARDILTPSQRDAMAQQAVARIDRDLQKVLPDGEREKLKAKIEQRLKSGDLPPPPPMDRP